MSPAFVRKIVYLLAIGFLLAPIYWLSHPATGDVKTQKGRSPGWLAQLRDEYGISQTQLGEVDLTTQTINLCTLGMRAFAANILWYKSEECKKKKDWTNLSAALEQITKVEPNFIGTWRYQAWNLSYNVSAAFDDYHDKYFWVIRGVRFLEEGKRYNDREPRLLWDIGWFISNKIGRADEKKLFRRLFKEDDDYNGSLPLDLRDNWLVGEEKFRDAERLVEATGVRCKGVAPLVFFSDAPMCHMSYSSALEDDGVFGEKARLAWKRAGQEWRQYGDRDILSYENHRVVLNSQERNEEESRKLVARLNAMSPGLREKMHKEKHDRLTPAQRKALDTPFTKRTPKQYTLVAEAEEKLKVTHKEVAMRLEGPQHAEAMDIARKIEDLEQKINMVRNDRTIVNFDYWRLRAEVEQSDAALSARKLIHQGDLAKADLARRPRGLRTGARRLAQGPRRLPETQRRHEHARRSRGHHQAIQANPQSARRPLPEELHPSGHPQRDEAAALTGTRRCGFASLSASAASRPLSLRERPTYGRRPG